MSFIPSPKKILPVSCGTTPLFTFLLPNGMSFDMVFALNVTFSQTPNCSISEKGKNDVLTSGERFFTVGLSQKETLGMSANRPLFIQARLVDAEGHAMNSRIYEADVLPALFKEVL